ncbi:CotH protein [Tautonia plasticadhaerens]|uniref:CotH protein n=1 Tax=Tautonia plasticadhaerens TaxID=2527974 RepID=A0A518H0R2_9BACT|nr:CotH kinase family protein [Tautonia plasticadhaerens]QDV34439.1 CotH protein [Tautonia plasticadhaerens]
MDPAIVDHPEFGGEALEAALRSIPTISLTTDLAHLFDPATGIYANSLQGGRDWERPASVELINPDGAPGFQAGAGVRIRGSSSAVPTNPKHSFRLFFRDGYGAPSLDFPLFGDEGVDSFEKLDLRTAQSLSWSFTGDPGSNFVAEVFARDTMRDLGQPYTRSRHYHLYLNGHYWGLYQSEERPSREFAESYFGGDEDDYDVVKVESGLYTIEATDGDLGAWRQLWQATTAPGGLSTLEAYYRVQGKDPDGSDNPAREVLLDVDNLIDYMATNLYIGNLDGPIGGDPSTGLFINNFYAIRNRAPDARQGFQFIMRDAEWSLLDHNVDRNGPYEVGSDFPRFNPQYLHQQLLANLAYREQFAARVRRYVSPGGPLTPEESIARFRARAAEIDAAVLAESARWGDAQRPDAPLTRADWLAAVDRVTSQFFPRRTGVFVDQLRDRGILPPDPSVVDPAARPVPGDYDADDVADLALFRRGTARGSFLASTPGGELSRDLGGPGDIPITGDFDGDDVADFAVFRPDSPQMPGASEWFISGSSNRGSHPPLRRLGPRPAGRGRLHRRRHHRLRRLPADQRPGPRRRPVVHPAERGRLGLQRHLRRRRRPGPAGPRRLRRRRPGRPRRLPADQRPGPRRRPVVHPAERPERRHLQRPGRRLCPPVRPGRRRPPRAGRLRRRRPGRRRRLPADDLRVVHPPIDRGRLLHDLRHPGRRAGAGRLHRRRCRRPGRLPPLGRRLERPAPRRPRRDRHPVRRPR